MILMAVGTAVSAYGTIQQGKAQKAQADFEAQQAALNARRAVGNANAEAEANDREQRFMEQGRKSTLAAQRAAVAASGLQISGSALDVMTDADLNAELQKADSRFISRVKQTNLLNQSQDLYAESGMLIRAGRSARKNANISAAGTLISGAGQAASAYKPKP